MLTCGCSTGGLDVVGLCLTKRGSRFTVGRFSLGFNIVLYVACALLFDIQTAIYSVIYTVFCSLFIDRGHQQNINVQVLMRELDSHAFFIVQEGVRIGGNFLRKIS